MTLLWVPLTGVLVKIVLSLIPDSRQGKQEEFHFLSVEEKLVGQPVAALRIMEEELSQFRRRVGELLSTMGSVAVGGDNDWKNRDSWERLSQEIKKLQSLYGELSEGFSLLLSAGTLSEEQANHVTARLKMLEDENRLVLFGEEFISTIVKQKLYSAKKGMSKEALREMETNLHHLSVMYHDFLELAEQGVKESAEETMKQREKMMKMLLDAYTVFLLEL
jgi:phosphate:Na+ symporter